MKGKTGQKTGVDPLGGVEDLFGKLGEVTVLMSSTVAKDAFEIGSYDMGDPRGVGARSRCVTGEGGVEVPLARPLTSHGEEVGRDYLSSGLKGL